MYLYVCICVFNCLLFLNSFLALSSLSLLFKIEEITKMKSVILFSLWWIKLSHLWQSSESLGNLHSKVYKIPSMPQQGGGTDACQTSHSPNPCWIWTQVQRIEVLHSFIAGKRQQPGLWKRTSWPSKAVTVSRGDEFNVNEFETSGSSFLLNKQAYENWWVKNLSGQRHFGLILNPNCL